MYVYGVNALGTWSVPGIWGIASEQTEREDYGDGAADRQGAGRTAADRADDGGRGRVGGVHADGGERRRGRPAAVRLPARRERLHVPAVGRASGPSRARARYVRGRGRQLVDDVAAAQGRRLLRLRARVRRPR